MKYLLLFLFLTYKSRTYIPVGAVSATLYLYDIKPKLSVLISAVATISPFGLIISATSGSCAGTVKSFCRRIIPK